MDGEDAESQGALGVAGGAGGRAVSLQKQHTCI